MHTRTGEERGREGEREAEGVREGGREGGREGWMEEGREGVSEGENGKLVRERESERARKKGTVVVDSTAARDGSLIHVT